MEKYINAREASEIVGVSLKTIQRWNNSGNLKCIRTPTAFRKIPYSEIQKILGETEHEIPKSRNVMIYGRVSSHEQKKKGDLDRQVSAIKDKLDLRIYENIEIITDVGSGLHDKGAIQDVSNLPNQTAEHTTTK